MFGRDPWILTKAIMPAALFHHLLPHNIFLMHPLCQTSLILIPSFETQTSRLNPDHGRLVDLETLFLDPPLPLVLLSHTVSALIERVYFQICERPLR
jgi:hypothetical protein